MVSLVSIRYSASEMSRLAIDSESRTIWEVWLHLILALKVILSMQVDGWVGGAGEGLTLLHLIRELGDGGEKKKNHA